MARRYARISCRITDARASVAEPEAEALEAMCARGKPRPKARSIAKGSWEGALRDVAVRVGTNDWESARPLAFVALYASLHVEVYGFESSELGGRDKMAAAGAAARMLERDFGGDGDEMAEFVRWLWRREKGREAWRRENKREGGKLTWRAQFAGRAFDEYRADVLRRRGGG